VTRQLIEPTVYRNDSSSKRQFIKTTVCRTTVYRTDSSSDDSVLNLIKPSTGDDRHTGRHFTGGAEKICTENNNLPLK